MYFNKIPSIVHSFYPKYLWRIPTDDKRIYLTFDDGPTKEVTEWVLAQLKSYKALATFFMVGNNVREYPEIAHKVIDGGHTVGNHTQNHLNGWKTNNRIYLRDVLKAQDTILEYTGYRPQLFRPPHGRLSSSQGQYLRESLDVVMMDIISGDFDAKNSGEACAKYVTDNASPGSIVVFHDSIKARERLFVALPLVLRHFSEAGYTFAPLSPTRNFEVKLSKVNF